MKICAITMTRGDRPMLLGHCINQMKAQTLQLDKHYIIDYKPIDNECDLIPRFKKGIEMAKADGMDFIYVIEDDDYYPNDYIEKTFKSDYDVIGCSKTIYYHVGVKGIKEMIHRGRSGLFTTAFKVDALDDYPYPNDNEPYLDIYLWRWVVLNKKHYLYDENIAVGIKHGIGKQGGNGHNAIRMKYIKDENYFINQIPFYNALTTTTIL